MVSENHPAAGDQWAAETGVDGPKSGFRRRLRSMCLVVLVPVVLSTLARHWWIADLCANLRVQWVIALSVVLCFSVFTAYHRLTVVILVALVVQVPWFRGSVSANRVQGASPEIVIMTANVYSPNRQHNEIVQQFLDSDADVIVVVELSTQLTRRLNGELSERYPHSVCMPQDAGNFGIGVYSKHAIQDESVVSFGNLSIPSVVLSTSVGGQPLRLVATHTFPPIGPGGFRHRNDHLNELAQQVGRWRREDEQVPVVVAGDLNLTPWSPIFHDFCEQADLVSESGDVWHPTWYAFPLFPFGLVLDHVLFTSDLQCCRRQVGSGAGSDHRFVTVVLTAHGE